MDEFVGHQRRKEKGSRQTTSSNARVKRRAKLRKIKELATTARGNAKIARRPAKTTNDGFDKIKNKRPWIAPSTKIMHADPQ